ncbi:MAG: chromosome segregation protein [Gammaproteobacteria bacterium]|jgi:chromosome segregation protein
MRLSQIKIAGFKSFVDPTKILFPAKITGIVGPNGCGKSNVIDAVRWVMGESSAKNLRGESMEDVIFSGSSGRKPVGQASVELVFDNSSGRVKGEYAKYNEISVKRIATRQGQSKYFLNNTRCRRRDIADIFLGTGLGPRSYSIIEQGMVSRIIDAKPDELRVYLEEAAGISKYKERRRETENRIRHTRENLDRLVDLIEEIEKQISRLDRQSKTAEKFKLLKKEQRQFGAECLLLQQNVYEADMVEQKSKLSGIETGMEQRTAGLRESERNIETCRAQLAEATEQHNQVQGDFYKLGSEISTKEQSIEHQKNLRQHNLQELENIQGSLLESKNIVETDSQKLAGLEQQIEQIMPGLGDSEAALQQLELSLAQVDKDKQDWQEQWDQFRREYHGVHESAQIENRGIEHIERQVQAASLRGKRLQDELDSLDSTAFIREIDALDASATAKSQEYEATTAQAQTHADDIQQLRQLIDQQSSQLDERRNQVQTLRGRLSSLEALQQHVLAESSDDVKQWLDRNSIRSSRRLTEMLKVKNNFEKAAEVVLTPFLAAYCVEPGQSIPDAFVPNHNVAVFDQNKVNAPANARDWDKLVDYINCDVDLSGLLSGIYVCADLQELRQRRTQLKAGESLVCAEGLWAGTNWILQLGDDDQHSGMLAREQEITGIRKQLDEITQSAMALKSQHDGDKQRLQNMEQQWDQDQKLLNELQQQLSAIRQQLSQHQSQAEQVQSRRQQLQKELAELDELNSKYGVELQSNSAKRNEFLGQIEKMSAQEEELLKQKEEKQQRLLETRQSVQQSREQFHQLQIRQQRLQSEQQATHSNLERMNQQAEQFASRLQSLQLTIAGAQNPITELESSLQILLQSRNKNEQTLKESQQVVSGLDHKQRELENERNNRQQAVDDFRGQLEAQRMQLQEVRIHSATITEQLEKTGLDIAEIQQGMDEQAELAEWQRRLEVLEIRIERLGPINLAAIDEYKEQAERKHYLDTQHQDLISALETLDSAIRKIDRETKDRFKETFEQVNTRISERFPKLFGGGEAHLEMTENDLLNTGVLIMARPPGKRVTNLQLLSGGEKALTAVALIFAIFELNPSPFCMLDEVDAPLDDANVGRFCSMVADMSDQVQFIMITHNKITMEIAQNLNGVTMHEPGVSRLVSVDVGEAVELAGVQ